MENKNNLFLAVGLSMIVYGGWLIYISKHPAPLSSGNEVTAGRSSEGPPAAASVAAGASASPSATPRSGAASSRLYPWKGAGVPLQFSSKGGSLAGFLFQDVSGPVELLPLEQSRFFATWPELDFTPAAAVDGAFAFETVHPSGLRLRKEYVWSGAQAGMHTLRIAVTNPTKKPITLEGWSLELGPGLHSVEAEADIDKNLRAVASWQEKKVTPTVKKLKPGPYEYTWNWVGVDNRYFLAALFVDPKNFSKATVGEELVGAHKSPTVRIAAEPAEIAPGATKTFEIPFFLGPKDYMALRAMGNGLDASVDFGTFGALGKLMFRALRSLHLLVGNYGVAIIIVTLCLQFLMLPMTLKSLRTSILMQKLQPKIQEIQKKFADDPKRMNVEMMELYKSSGTNPLGGCLPLLAQLPIFWALFTMLRNCWELHGAPFAFWITDLSLKDPFHVMPIVMGGLMFVQQKVNPAAGDPAQQRVFMFMPLIFVFMFWSFPAGLVLYWMVSSLFGLAQQYLFRKYAKI